MNTVKLNEKRYESENQCPACRGFIRYIANGNCVFCHLARHHSKGLPARRKITNQQRLDEAAARTRQWRIDNPEKFRNQSRIYSLLYHRRYRRATPAWLTAEHYDLMRSIYERAKEVTSQTGVDHEVDHIVPIRSKVVCGLHVPWNLRILTKHANRAKHNRLLD